MDAQFDAKGDAVDYQPSAAVSAGDIEKFNPVRIAKKDIAASALGALVAKGVFKFTKDTGTGTALAVDTPVYWDSTNEYVTTTPNGKYLGVVVAAATTADTTVKVKINVPQPVFIYKHTCTSAEATAEAVTIDTLFGATPAGPVIVQVLRSGVDVHCDATRSWGTGSTLGQLTLTEKASSPNWEVTAGDVIHIVAYR